MPKRVILIVAALAAGCATAPEEVSVLERNDAIDDYIRVAELAETDAIRSYGQLSHKVVTEKYIIIYDGSDAYIVTYMSNCRAVNDRNIQPDIRYESNVLRARSDTFRGCRIKSMHALSKEQAEELINLGKAPG